MSNSQTSNFIKLPSKRSISPVTKMMTKAQSQTTVICHESNSDSITKSTCIKILALHYHENWGPYCEKLQNKTERHNFAHASECVRARARERERERAVYFESRSQSNLNLHKFPAFQYYQYIQVISFHLTGDADSNTNEILTNLECLPNLINYEKKSLFP